MIRTHVFAISVALSLAILVGAVSSRTAAQGSAALTGVVSSQAEGAMEGVLVSAKRVGSTMTMTVVSDAQGRYAFPGNRLEPGAYAVRIRATGYDVEGPASADVAATHAVVSPRGRCARVTACPAARSSPPSTLS